MRLVSLDPGTTELLFAIGATEELAVSKLCDYPEEVRQKQIVGSPTKPDYDLIEEIRPALVFTTDEKVKQRLESVGLNVFLVKSGKLSDVYDNFLKIGELVHKLDETKALVNSIKGKLLNHRNHAAEHTHIQIKDAPSWILGLGEYFGAKIYNPTVEDLDSFQPKHTLELPDWARPSPRLPKLVQYLGSQVHPTKFKAFGTMRKDIDDWYEDIELPDPKGQYAD